MSAATSLGYSYQRFRWPAQSLPFSSFSSQARCLGLRVLIFGGAAASSGMGPSLETVVTEHRFQRASGVAQLCRDAAREFELKKCIGGALQIHAVAKPPGLFAARQTVDIDVFHLDHFQQPGLAVRATPAAGAAAAVGSFGNSKITDRVVHHDCSRAQTMRDSL